MTLTTTEPTEKRDGTDLWRFRVSGQYGFERLPGTHLTGESIGADAEIINGFFVVFGGNNNTVLNDWHEIAATNPGAHWGSRTFGNPAPSRSGHTMDLVGGKLYLFGGWDTTAYYNDLHTIDTSYFLGPAAPQWTVVAARGGPSPRNGHSAVEYAGSIYFFGGFFHDVSRGPEVHCSSDADGCVWHNDLWRFNPVSQQWSHVVANNQPPARRSDHSAVVIGNSMYVFGGQVYQCCTSPPRANVQNDLWRYDFLENTWEELTPSGPPGARRDHVAAVVGDHMYIYAGRDDHAQALVDFWVYTPGIASTSTGSKPEPIELEGLKAAVVFNIFFTLALLFYHMYQYRHLLRCGNSAGAGTSEPLNSSQ